MFYCMAKCVEFLERIFPKKLKYVRICAKIIKKNSNFGEYNVKNDR